MKIKYISQEDKENGVVGITVFDCGHSIPNTLVHEFRDVGHVCVECAISSNEMVYARKRGDTIYLYKRDDGPSGVTQMASGPAHKVSALLRAAGRSTALSPTERY